MRELVSSSRAIIQLFPFPPYPSPSFPTSSILFPLCLLVLYVFLLSSSAFFLLPNISSPSLHTFPRSYSHPFLFYFSLSLPLLFPYSFHILSFHSHPKFSPSLFPTFHQPLFPLLPLFSLPPFSSPLPSPFSPALPSPFLPLSSLLLLSTQSSREEREGSPTAVKGGGRGGRRGRRREGISFGRAKGGRGCVTPGRARGRTASKSLAVKGGGRGRKPRVGVAMVTGQEWSVVREGSMDGDGDARVE